LFVGTEELLHLAPRFLRVDLGFQSLRHLASCGLLREELGAMLLERGRVGAAQKNVLPRLHLLLELKLYLARLVLSSQLLRDEGCIGRRDGGHLVEQYGGCT
jgi:hypothetical protein